MKPIAHLYITARQKFCDWYLEPVHAKKLRVRGCLKLGTELPLERIVELAGDYCRIVLLRVIAPAYRIVSWPKRLHPEYLVLRVKEFPHTILHGNKRLERAMITSATVPEQSMRCPSKLIQRIWFVTPCVNSFDFLRRLPNAHVQCNCFHQIPWSMPSSVFEVTPVVFSPDHRDIERLLASSRVLVTAITAGLGAEQGAWTSFLMRGLYDPRLFAVIIRFIAVFHCCQ